MHRRWVRWCMPGRGRRGARTLGRHGRGASSGSWRVPGISETMRRQTFQKQGCDLSRTRVQIFRLILPNIVTGNMWGCRAAKTAVPGRFNPHILTPHERLYRVGRDGRDGITLNERRISSVNDLFAGRFQPDSLERKGVRRSYSTLRKQT